MLTALFLAQAVAAAPAPDPIEPAARGMLQCVGPDVERKRCMSIASFERRPGGRIIVNETSMVSPSPFIVTRASTQVEVRKGAVCSLLTRKDLDAVTYEIDGERPSKADEDAIRLQVQSLVEPTLGKKVCVSYARRGARLMMLASLDGRRAPAADMEVIWVRPDEGYQVAP